MHEPNSVPVDKREKVSKMPRDMPKNDITAPTECFELVRSLVKVLKNGKPVPVCTDLYYYQTNILVGKYALPAANELTTWPWFSSFIATVKVNAHYASTAGTQLSRYVFGAVYVDGQNTVKLLIRFLVSLSKMPVMVTITKGQK